MDFCYWRVRYSGIQLYHLFKETRLCSLERKKTLIMEDPNVDLPNILQELPEQVVDSFPMDDEPMEEEVANVNSVNLLCKLNWVLSILDVLDFSLDEILFRRDNKFCRVGVDVVDIDIRCCLPTLP